MSDQPYVVVWRLTEACDLDCGFCDFRRSNRFVRSRLEGDEVRRVSLLIQEWAQQRLQQVVVSWLGGEPLLWPDILNVSRALRCSGIRTSVTTNGRLMAKSRHNPVDILRAFDEITLSIDGSEGTHDASRGVLGLFQSVLALARELRSGECSQGQRVKIRSNLLLCRASLPEFRSIIHECLEAGVTEFTINTLWVPAGHALAHLRLLPSDVEELRRSVFALRSELDGRGKILGSERYFSRLYSYACGHKVFVNECYPGARTLFVDADGRLAPCAYTGPEYGVDMRSIRTVDEMNILLSRFRAQRANRLASACYDCPDTNVFGKFE